jgi:hypothetical protein
MDSLILGWLLLTYAELLDLRGKRSGFICVTAALFFADSLFRVIYRFL